MKIVIEREPSGLLTLIVNDAVEETVNTAEVIALLEIAQYMKLQEVFGVGEKSE